VPQLPVGIGFEEDLLGVVPPRVRGAQQRHVLLDAIGLIHLIQHAHEVRRTPADGRQPILAPFRKRRWRAPIGLGQTARHFDIEQRVGKFARQPIDTAVRFIAVIPIVHGHAAASSIEIRRDVIDRIETGANRDEVSIGQLVKNRVQPIAVSRAGG